VDNSVKINVGPNAHSISDHTQTNWNGIIGEISIQALANQQILHADVYPSGKEKNAKLILELQNMAFSKVNTTLITDLNLYNSDYSISVPGRETSIVLKPGTTRKEITIDLGEQVQLWDEFEPNLYSMNLKLTDKKGETLDSREITFGVRDIRTQGTQFILNGRKVFMRGTLECAIFPLTGYPSMDVESWRQIYRKGKAYGLNHFRFHSWCPPEAAFTAADLEGVYLQPECSVWAYAREDELKNFIRKEAQFILKEYGNHPSFVFLGYGNEAGVPEDFMEELLAEWEKDSRRLYTGPANANITPSYDFAIAVAIPRKRNPPDPFSPGKLRYQDGWPPLPQYSFFNSEHPHTSRDYRVPVHNFGKPVIAHETVQRCTYPNLDRRVKYKGLLYPAYLDIAEDQLMKHHLISQVEDFVRASGKWQVQQFKEEIEAHLRTPGMGGFQLLQLNDFTGQGTALVGVLDAFWESKGYITAEEFSRFCNELVPLLRMEKRVWLENESFRAKLEVANFSRESYANARFKWRVTDKTGRIVKSGRMITGEIKVDNGIEIGEISFNLSGLPSAAKYNIEIRMEGTDFINDWDFWLFPAYSGLVDHGQILISANENEALEALGNGRTVLLIPEKSRIKGEIPPCFTSIYWNCAWTDVGESSTMGILTDPADPVFKSFPTDFHSNWHWWELLVDARPMILDGLPGELFPLIQLIDDYHQNRKLGVLFEGKVSNGKLLVCSMDISSDLEKRHVARQFRNSLISYMLSDNFNPRHKIEPGQVLSLFQRE
jgi:hypothetical protein